MWSCPQCGSTKLTVQVTITAMAELIQYGENDHAVDMPFTVERWDRTSPMQCSSCHHQAAAAEFETTLLIAA